MVSVVDFITSEEHEKFNYEVSIGGLGGFFKEGMRWNYYICNFDKKDYYEAIREYVIKNNIKQGGDWHQIEGIPLFSDNTVGSFSFRAWGDLLAAIWSEYENKDYCYMDFYMDCLIEERENSNENS
jgi:hypothetical protein